MCFYNAQSLMLGDDRLIYVEGFVLTAADFPILHGWCVSGGSNIAIESTLRVPALAYLGIRIKREIVRERIERTNVYGSMLDNYADHWPMLAQEVSKWRA